MKKSVLPLLGFICLIASCKNDPKGEKSANDSSIVTNTQSLKINDWGTYDNKPVFEYVLTNGKGSVVTLSNYGATVTGWTFPDKEGNNSQIVIGFDSLSGYLQHPPYFGATIGRFGNRIAKGKFKLEGKEYTVATNDGANHLHGGKIGFDKVIWEAIIPDSTKPAIDFHYVSKDGEEGYPGNLDVTVHYVLTDDNELKITYDATTDKPTIINMTNHSYFNLSGNLENTVLGETLQINADKYTPVSNLIPTGQLLSVKGTPYDFTTPHTIGEMIAKTDSCYDHNFVLNTNGDISKPAAVLSDAKTGRELTLYTTNIGVQVYTSCYLKGEYTAHNNQKTVKFAAVTLETQHYPDAPNQPTFPSVELKPGEKYHQETIYKIALKK
ncbi:MAG: galactose-1-epimerase [Pseudopedobacter saltans]|uniref:Aldose 1-epimerase n=1 Tax=Pseudopedobacter saltans TaxID=151895 RepID=A0A2W5EDX0_9SPHI|nr:MAG: galactose-1-epimerase [Pseudopedobacter saltans]